MNPRRLAPLLILLVLLVQVAPTLGAPQYRYTMSYTFENRGASPATLMGDDIAAPLFVQTQWQRVTVASATPPLGAEYTDEDGNGLANPDMSLTVPGGAKVTYTVVYNIESSAEQPPQFDASKAGTAADIPQELVSEYTGSTETFMADDANISALARSLTESESTVLGKLKLLVKWFYDNVDYASHEVPLYPNETLALREGDCDDQSILLISMLRSLGIPSYLEVGMVIGSGVGGSETTWDGHLTIVEEGVGWHGWAVVYTPPWGWIPVDLTLVHDADPMKMINGAPEYTASVLTVFVVSKQAYTTLGVETRQRIIDSTLYITSTEKMESMQSPLINYTMILLTASIVVAVAVMFYTSRRRPERQTL